MLMTSSSARIHPWIIAPSLFFAARYTMITVMELKKCFAAANCLALLLVVGGRAEGARAGAAASRFDAVGGAVTRQRRIARRATRRRVSKRMKQVGLAEGLWGGAHIGLTVREGGAEVEFDCAHGTIERRIVLDAYGRFDVGGTFVPEGGPVSISIDGVAQEKSYSARYRGRVEGRRMTLNVLVSETGATFDDLTLSHGRAPVLEKCY
jgi:hypothetical protein